MSSEIQEIEVKVDTPSEIVPKLEFASPLETALATNDSYLVRLEPLFHRAHDLKGKVAGSKENYEAIGQILSEVRSIKKNEIAPLWSPFKGVIEKVREFVKQRQQKGENRCTEIEAICTSEMKLYEIAEAKATAKEQKKHPEGTVVADIPAVAGYRRSTTYPITVEDPKALLRALLKAYKSADTKRVQFFLQFVTLDEQAVAKYARELKDPKQFNAEMPGITCRKDGA